MLYIIRHIRCLSIYLSIYLYTLLSGTTLHASHIMICYSFKLSCLRSASSLVPSPSVFPLFNYLLFFIIIMSYPIFDVKFFEINVFFFFFQTTIWYVMLGVSNPGLINLCVLFLDAKSAPNKGNVNAQNMTYAHSLCLRRQQRGGKCMSCHCMYFLGSWNIFVFPDTPRGP